MAAEVAERWRTEISEAELGEAARRTAMALGYPLAAERWERFQRTEELMDQASFVHLRTHIWRLLRDEQPDVEAVEPNGGVTP